MKTAPAAKGGYLYERPWYVIIGPPGRGKTTAIQNSGLDFPLVAGRVSGRGRNAQLRLVDRRAGGAHRHRRPLHDAGQRCRRRQGGLGAVPRPARRERPRQPLNGVIVAFGVDLLSRLDPGRAADDALAVRRRVSELRAEAWAEAAGLLPRHARSTSSSASPNSSTTSTERPASRSGA